MKEYLNKMADNDPMYERETYLDERKILIDLERESSRSFDKAILTLAAGALGLSITFLRYISPKPIPGSLDYLIMAWSGLGASMLLTLTSFLLSQSAMRRQREILDRGMQAGEDEDIEEKNRFASATNILNWLSLVFFILGAGLFAYFSFVNLPK